MSAKGEPNGSLFDSKVSVSQPQRPRQAAWQARNLGNEMPMLHACIPKLEAFLEVQGSYSPNYKPPEVRSRLLLGVISTHEPPS